MKSYISNSNQKVFLIPKTQKNLQPHVPQESFFGHMKDEIDITNCTSFDEVNAIIDDWINYYNNDRYQWQLAKLVPNEYYNYITTGVYPIK